MRTALWVLVAIVLLGGGYWWWSMSGTTSTVNNGASSEAPGAAGTVLEGSGATTDNGVGGDTAAPMAVTVTYDGKGFSPQDVTVKKGGTVTWKNASTGNMNVASAQHPTHTVYDDTSRSAHCAASYTGPKPFDQCSPGGDYSFTFEKLGKNGYHDHINASAFGSVTVVE